VVGNSEAADLLRGFLTREVLGRLATALPVEKPEARASLAASQLVGVAFVRHILRVEPLASASVAEVAGWTGPTLQRYLTESLAVQPA